MLEEQRIRWEEELKRKALEEEFRRQVEEAREKQRKKEWERGLDWISFLDDDDDEYLNEQVCAKNLKSFHLLSLYLFFFLSYFELINSSIFPFVFLFDICVFFLFCFVFF